MVSVTNNTPFHQLTCGFERLDPFAGAAFLLLDNVSGDRGAAVVLRRLPLELHKVLVPVGRLRTARSARLLCGRDAKAGVLAQGTVGEWGRRTDATRYDEVYCSLRVAKLE